VTGPHRRRDSHDGAAIFFSIRTEFINLEEFVSQDHLLRACLKTVASGPSLGGGAEPEKRSRTVRYDEHRRAKLGPRSRFSNRL
jgi:hypothetical protein